MNFRPIAAEDGTFLPWIKSLCGRSGTYVIRSVWLLKPVLYVGESHTGNLSKTLKRHFFTWRDKPDRAHNVYNRHGVTVAVRLLSAKKAVAAQNRLIERLRPRDNGYVPEPAAPKEENPF